MKGRAISYCTEMVRANRDGRKSNTRRVMNPQPWFTGQAPGWRDDGIWEEEGDGCHYLEALDAAGNPTENYHSVGKCPYGKVGDVLWVRETWTRRGEPVSEFYYESDAHETFGDAATNF